MSVDATLGWINLLLVWSLFAAAGMRLAALRALPRTLLVSALALSVLAAVALVLVGPYSSALITTTATPGITNLAPPTLVLAFAGLAQVCVLLLVWPVLARLLSRDAVWVAVAVFASRSMELYLWHMLGFTAAIGAVLATGVAPAALTVGWWLLHAAVAVLVVSVVWLLAPLVARAARGLAHLLDRVVPFDLGRAHVAPVMGCAVVASATLLAVSESGMADPFAPRIVIVLPYLPAAALAVIAVVIGISRTRPPD